MNPDRNFLAYLRNKCYSLRVFNNVIILDMRSVKKIMASFGGAAAALGLATSPVFAQSAPEPTQVAMVSVDHNVQIIDDADHAANEFVVGRPDRFAVSVRIGDDTLVPAERVEEVLRRDLADQGKSDVIFYFERGGEGDTTVSYHTDGRVFGSYPLATARDQIAFVVDQTRFNQQYAANMN